MSKVVGYKRCRSGLNNQKHCLLGLLAHAVETSADITLPLLANFATDGRGALSEIRFEDIFDIQRFMSMAGQLGVAVRTGEPVENVNFHDMFQIGSRVSRECSDASQALSRLFWRNLRPAAPLEGRIREFARTTFESKAVQAVVQLRIEPDWQSYVNTGMRAAEGEDTTTSYQAILTKVANTFGGSVSPLYVTCDETQVPIEEVNRYASEVLNLLLVWKSQVVGSAIPADELCLRTTIDFELALRSKIFIGTTRSTFANTVCMTKTALEPDADAQYFIYNLPGQLLERRRDGGIYADVLDAIRSS